jgi:ABC-2 type transport system permease protein
LTFPLLFMSTALMDPSLMPLWMRNVSAYNPISFAVNAMRDLIMTGYNLNSFFLSFGVISLIAILTMGATIYEFRKVVS